MKLSNNTQINWNDRVSVYERQYFIGEIFCKLSHFLVGLGSLRRCFSMPWSMASCCFSLRVIFPLKSETKFTAHSAASLMGEKPLTNLVLKEKLDQICRAVDNRGTRT